MKPRMPRLTYANVVATLALFLALGGGAYAAIQLPKNSVKSKQLAKGAVKNPDIAKDAVTGDKVKESTLGKVPSAATADTAANAASAAHATSADTAATANALAGISSSGIGKTQVVARAFTSPLELRVSGYGTYFLNCDTNSASLFDDEVAFGYINKLGPNAIESGLYSTAPAIYSTPSTTLIGGRASTAASATLAEAPAVSILYSVTVEGTPKSITIIGGGFDDQTTPGCAGELKAVTSG